MMGGCGIDFYKHWIFTRIIKRHFYKKIDHSRSLFHLFLSFQIHITILQQIYVKNVHPVYGAWIRIQDLQDMSLLP